jgi:hypothetical protein
MSLAIATILRKDQFLELLTLSSWRNCLPTVTIPSPSISSAPLTTSVGSCQFCGVTRLATAVGKEATPRLVIRTNTCRIGISANGRGHEEEKP